MVRKALIFMAAILALAAEAVGAQAAATWNSGYNGWWPSGFGYPPMTMHASLYPCSVTAYGPTFHARSGGWTLDYGGGTSCVGGVGTKTLTLYEQVLGQDRRTWHTISGSKVMVGPMSGNPVRASRNRPASIGHSYRTVASAQLVVPNGHAGCSLSGTCSQTITITSTSPRLAP